MQSCKRAALRIGAGFFLLLLTACAQGSGDGLQPLDPAQYVGTWTRQDGSVLEKLVLTEDTWLFVKGDTFEFPNYVDTFVYYQGGKGSLAAYTTQIELTLDAVWAPSGDVEFSWFAKGTPTYAARALFEQKTMPFQLTDTEITLDLGGGPQTYTKQ